MKATWIRISCWTGAIADSIGAYAMLTPEISASPEYRYALGMAAGLMIGWTVMLIWASMKPIERRATVMMTNIPVIGIIASEIYAIQAGLITMGKAIPIVVFLIGLVALFTFSYIYTSNEVRS